MQGVRIDDLGRHCTNTRIFWSMTSEPRMDSKRNCRSGRIRLLTSRKRTGEVISDTLKCAIVLSRSPAPIRTYLRVQNGGDYGAPRVAVMNYLEAEDDGHGPVPMEVGAMKGKKGDKGQERLRQRKVQQKLWKVRQEQRSTARTRRVWQRQ